MMGQIFLVAFMTRTIFSFHRIDATWGPHSTDRFANHLLNAKLTRFNTRFWKPKVKKDPVTSEMSKALVESKITHKSPLRILHLLPRAILITRSFWRFSELYHIKPAMLRFRHLMCPFYLESSKCDHVRDGPRIVDLPTCPVKALEVYISRLKSDFQRIYRCTGPLLLLVQRKDISYTRARELIKDAFRNFTRLFED